MIVDATLSGRTSVLNDRLSSIYPVNGTKLICPKCGKTFTVTDDTRYLYGKDYVCDWKCFLTPINKEVENLLNSFLEEYIYPKILDKDNFLGAVTFNFLSLSSPILDKSKASGLSVEYIKPLSNVLLASVIFCGVGSSLNAF